jgi:hypothetical protein
VIQDQPAKKQVPQQQQEEKNENTEKKVQEILAIKTYRG